MDKYLVSNAHEISTPSLLVYPEIIKKNIENIGSILGGYDRLRPHIKTHKMSRIVRMELEAGIDKFKCTTLKEATMLVSVGASDILISYPIVGAAVERVVALKICNPCINLKVIADNVRAVKELSVACVSAKVTLGVTIDLDTGMGRTGVLPGDATLTLARTINDLPALTLEGLHVYDGHLLDFKSDDREIAALESIRKAVEIRRCLEKEGLEVKSLVASGSPGFMFTASNLDVEEVSPGTWIFWDMRYDESVSSLFQWAALVLSSVISIPGPGLITLDAGSKAIAPDTTSPHFQVLNLPERVEFCRRNEEHQVLQLPADSPQPEVGDLLYLVPRHVCTTVNLWDEACVIDSSSKFIEMWPVDARGH